jgi:hypothetical protein
VMYIDI